MVIYHTDLLFHCTFRCNAHDLQYLIRILNMQKQRGRAWECSSRGWQQWKADLEDSSYPTSEVSNIHKVESLLFTGGDNSPATYSTWHRYHLIMVVIESWLVNRGLLLRDTISHNLAAASLSFPNQRLGVPFPSVVMATVVTTILMFVLTQTSSYHLKTKSTPC